MDKRFAEDANYFDTSVAPGKSLGEVQELLDDFGAEATMVTQGKAGDSIAWLVRFQWRGKSYRFTFQPLKCRYPNQINSYDKKRRSHAEQAKWQMGRIAVWFVKAILTAAETQPDALFGFVELPGAAAHGDLPPTAAEVGVEGMTGLLPSIDLPRLGGGDIIDGEVEER